MVLVNATFIEKKKRSKNHKHFSLLSEFLQFKINFSEQICFQRLICLSFSFTNLFWKQCISKLKSVRNLEIFHKNIVKRILGVNLDFYFRILFCCKAIDNFVNFSERIYSFFFNRTKCEIERIFSPNSIRKEVNFGSFMWFLVIKQKKSLTIKRQNIVRNKKNHLKPIIAFCERDEKCSQIRASKFKNIPHISTETTAAKKTHAKELFSFYKIK